MKAKADELIQAEIQRIHSVRRRYRIPKKVKTETKRCKVNLQPLTQREIRQWTKARKAPQKDLLALAVEALFESADEELEAEGEGGTQPTQADSEEVDHEGDKVQELPTGKNLIYCIEYIKTDSRYFLSVEIETPEREDPEENPKMKPERSPQDKNRRGGQHQQQQQQPQQQQQQQQQPQQQAGQPEAAAGSPESMDCNLAGYMPPKRGYSRL
jgi:hypothetical protein